jgi:hypothetical protein
MKTIKRFQSCREQDIGTTLELPLPPAFLERNDNNDILPGGGVPNSPKAYFPSAA